MNLAARCPACGTVFRVVPDQLKISDGRVRCGYCSEIFDARTHLLDSDLSGGAQAASKVALGGDTSQTPSDPPPTQLDEVAQAPENGVQEKPIPLIARTRILPSPVSTGSMFKRPSSDTGGPISTPVAVAPPQPDAGTPPSASSAQGQDTARLAMPQVSPGEPDFSPQPAELAPKGRSEPLGQNRPASPSPLHVREPTFDLDAHPASFPLADPLAQIASRSGTGPHSPEMAFQESRFVPEEAPTFVRTAKRQAFWKRSDIKLYGVGVLLLLALMLGLQLARVYHDTIAARFPGLRAPLAALCRPLGCSIADLRRIDDIAVDNAAFRRLSSNTYSLGLTLRNRGSLPIAVPWIELTLMDTDGRTLVRRVLSPEELGIEPDVLAASEERNAQARFTVDMAGISGYRVLAFYP